MAFPRKHIEKVQEAQEAQAQEAPLPPSPPPAVEPPVAAGARVEDLLVFNNTESIPLLVEGACLTRAVLGKLERLERFARGTSMITAERKKHFRKEFLKRFTVKDGKWVPSSTPLLGK